ncbi:hypothetical protein FPRO06_09264 [Fusarium proliferatum]|uniref:Holin-like protein CidB n=1 Tax=Gibberella intermedia TaxID=948311 RepID=A0A365NPD1_GIBIN|nr:hypothetical protein FPRO03_03973 [Fusarium proliferatum]KAG4277427.1 hypothetical protein FPRO04_07204 [Fusarium proliferatum]KAG4282591.1 hypothetical protein FPRO06_09264 [Fusarium proliferatum]RBA22675.1 hypothetical protein FPRO05_01022 [Fusarium proliferatum]
MAADTSDLLQLMQAIKLVANKNSSKLVRAWFYVPLGITIILAVNFGVDSIFYKFNVSFPASVTCMMLLFFALIASESLLGTHKTRKLVNIIDVPAGWSLRWMGIFFTPSFVLLPLSPPIGIIEVMVIIAIFVIGFFIMMAMAAWITRSLQLALGVSRRSRSQRAEELGRQTPDLSTGDVNSPGISRRTSVSRAGSQIPLMSVSAPNSEPTSAAPSRPQTPPQLRLQEHHYANGQAPVNAVEALNPTTVLTQIPLPPPKAELWAARISANLDVAIFVGLFAFIGFPLYYSTGYAMPLHLAVNVLAWFGAFVGSLLAYPPLCYACGISAARSLAFASRSLTLALAVPATDNLGGDVNTAAALAIISGILGAVLGARILRWLRVPEDDYVTRGVTLGVNSSAIATSVLLRTDPRAAALSSLSMSLFGTITVLFTSIPPAAAFVRGLVGL